MTGRKPADPKDEVQLSRVLRDRPEQGGAREGAEEPIVPNSDEVHPGEDGGIVERVHPNVELESGPVDREDEDDPLPQAP